MRFKGIFITNMQMMVKIVRRERVREGEIQA